jgi:hypothetical protein
MGKDTLKQNKNSESVSPRSYRNQTSAIVRQITNLPRRFEDPPDSALQLRSERNHILYHPDGAVHAIARDHVRSLAEREVTFAELKDGTFVDLIRDPDDWEHFGFIIRRPDGVGFKDHVVDGDRILKIPQGYEHILRNLVLPSGVMPYQSASALARKIRDAIRSCVDVPNPYPSLLAAFALYTWIADRLPSAVYLYITGLPESGKTALLQVMRLFCRRSLLTADTSPAGVSEVCSMFSPTIMIDEAECDRRGSSRDLARLLRAGTNSNQPVVRARSYGSVFGPKILCSEDLPDDLALLSRCIVIPMTQGDTSKLRRPTDPDILESSRELQKRLLGFRFEVLSKVQPVCVPGAERLSPRRQDLLAALASPFSGDPDWPELLLQCLANTDEWSRPSLLPEEAAVLDGLWSICHSRRGYAFVSIKELLSLIVEICEDADENVHLDSAAVGRILRKFAIGPSKHTNSGNGFLLIDKSRLSIHKLVRKYGLALVAPALACCSQKSCKLCESMEIESRGHGMTEVLEGSEGDPALIIAETGSVAGTSPEHQTTLSNEGCEGCEGQMDTGKRDRRESALEPFRRLMGRANLAKV